MANTKIKKEFLDDTLLAETITTYTSDAAPVPTGSSRRNTLVVTALAVNTTIGAPTGSPTVGNMIKVSIANITASHTIGYNAALTAGNITRTTTLAANQELLQIYEYLGSAWVCVYDSGAIT